MATTQVVNVKVQELTRYGFKSNDRYVNYSKNLSETDKAKVVPGTEFEAEFYVSDGGKEYLNKIIGTNVPQTQSAAASSMATPPDVERAKKFTPKFGGTKPSASEAMTKAEWSAKDRSQLIGGLCHDAAQLTLAALTVGVTVDKVLVQYKQMLDGVIALRAEVK